MKVKYNKELAKAVLKGEIRGEFYHKPDNTLVYPKLITYQGKDLVCFAISCPNSNRVGEFTSFTTISPQTEEAMSIRLFDFEVGDIVACKVDNGAGTLVGVLTDIHLNEAVVSCWANLETGTLHIDDGKFCTLGECLIPSAPMTGGFLNILDKNGYYLKDGKPCKKVKHFEPFEKVIIYTGVWRGDFFSHIEGDYYITTSTRRLKKDEIKPYKGNEYLIGTKCD